MPPTPPISRHTARTLEALRADLLALEQGCEPNLDRLLRQLAALVSAEDTVEQSELADLGERLSEYLDELREEGTPIALEDIDLLLEHLPGDGVGDALSVPDVPRLVQGPPPEVPGHAPEFRASGISLDLRGPVVHLTLPEMPGHRSTSQVLVDLTEIWSQFPVEFDWWLDLRQSDPLPAALIAELRRLQLTSAPEVRRIALIGVREQLRSTELRAALGRHFDLL